MSVCAWGVILEIAVGVGRSGRESGIIDLCDGFGDLSLSSMDSLFRWLFFSTFPFSHSFLE